MSTFIQMNCNFMKGPELKIEFCAYYNDKKEKFDEGGLYPFLEWCQSAKPKDLTVRVDYEMGFDEMDIYCESLSISNLSYEKINDSDFVATFTCDSKSGKPIMRVIYALGKAGNGGHSYEFIAGKQKFYFDGDGADRIIKINGVKFHTIKTQFDLGKVWNDTTNKDNNSETENEMNVNEDIIYKSVKKAINEFVMPNNPSTDYEGNDLNFDNIVDQAVSVIYNMEQNGEEIKWVNVAKNMGFRLETLNSEDMELLHDAIEHAMALPGINESHGTKKHKGPKDALAAMRKGNREADQEMYGGGFRQTKKVHKAKNDYDRKGNKIDVNNIDKFREDESVNRISMNDIHYMVTECVKRILKEDIREDLDGVVDWGANIEPLIDKLEKKFASVIAPEENEFGMASTPLEDLISHLKYYYDHQVFDSYCFNSIYKMLDNYDFIQDEEVMGILRQLKKYC